MGAAGVMGVVAEPRPAVQGSAAARPEHGDEDPPARHPPISYCNPSQPLHLGNLLGQLQGTAFSRVALHDVVGQAWMA